MDLYPLADPDEIERDPKRRQVTLLVNEVKRLSAWARNAEQLRSIAGQLAQAAGVAEPLIDRRR